MPKVGLLEILLFSRATFFSRNLRSSPQILHFLSELPGYGDTLNLNGGGCSLDRTPLHSTFPLTGNLTGNSGLFRASNAAKPSVYNGSVDFRVFRNRE